jgi:hypothetical protein
VSALSHFPAALEQLRHHPAPSQAAGPEALELLPSELTAQLQAGSELLPSLVADPAETQIQLRELQRMARLPLWDPAAVAVAVALLGVEGSAETGLPARLS